MKSKKFKRKSRKQLRRSRKIWRSRKQLRRSRKKVKRSRKVLRRSRKKVKRSRKLKYRMKKSKKPPKPVDKSKKPSKTVRKKAVSDKLSLTKQQLLAIKTRAVKARTANTCPKSELIRKKIKVNVNTILRGIKSFTQYFITTDCCETKLITILGEYHQKQYSYCNPNLQHNTTTEKKTFSNDDEISVREYIQIIKHNYEKVIIGLEYPEIEGFIQGSSGNTNEIGYFYTDDKSILKYDRRRDILPIYDNIYDSLLNREDMKIYLSILLNNFKEHDYNKVCSNYIPQLKYKYKAIITEVENLISNFDNNPIFDQNKIQQLYTQTTDYEILYRIFKHDTSNIVILTGDQHAQNIIKEMKIYDFIPEYSRYSNQFCINLNGSSYLKIPKRKSGQKKGRSRMSGSNIIL